MTAAELAAVLRWQGSVLQEGAFFSAASRIEALEAENARLREALEQIAVTCQEEIEARTAGMSERGLKGYRILALLQLPRDMARAALTRKGTTP